MFSRFTSYKYSTLRPATGPDVEFRLLTILPSAAGGKIECTLQHASLNNPPLYEALSYTWGDPKGSLCEIPAKGDPTRLYGIRIGRQRAKVTYNLHSALQQLRSQKVPRVVWVDAICIDQKNDAEKSEQVQLMAKIYNQASKVLVWLGEDDRYIAIAFETLEQFCWVIKVCVWQRCSKYLSRPLSEITEDMVASWIALEVENDRSSDSFHSPFPGDINLPQVLKALSVFPIDFSTATNPAQMAIEKFGQDSLPAHMFFDQHKLSEYPNWQEMNYALKQVFLNRNYWTRLWVMQELISTTDTILLCGGRQVDGVIVHLLMLAEIERDPDSGGSQLLGNLDRDAADELEDSLYWLTLPDEEWRVQPRTLFAAWNAFSLKFCSEPRDHIYALLNIVQPIAITVDYSKPIVDLFSDTTKAIINQEENFNILYEKRNGPFTSERSFRGHVVHGLPSWVPNYAAQQGKWGLINSRLPLDRQNYGGGGPIKLPSTTVGGLNDRHLEIYGSFSGKIVNAGGRIPLLLEDDEILRAVEQFRLSLPAETRSKESPDSFDEEEFWRIMVGDVYNVSPNHRARVEWREEARSILRHDITTAKASNMPIRMIERVKDTISCGHLCTTTGKSVAIVQGNVEVGDDIFIARGAALPLIIRAVENNERAGMISSSVTESKFYRFIGGSYVHGSMDGQILEEREAEGLADETVILI